VHLILISLPTHFGQFKVSYNTLKDTWSLNELISHCVQEEERLQQHKESVRLRPISIKKKRETNAVTPSQQRKTKKQNGVLTCFFCKKT